MEQRHGKRRGVQQYPIENCSNFGKRLSHHIGTRSSGGSLWQELWESAIYHSKNLASNFQQRYPSIQQQIKNNNNMLGGKRQ